MTEDGLTCGFINKEEEKKTELLKLHSVSLTSFDHTDNDRELKSGDNCKKNSIIESAYNFISNIQ